MKDNTEDTRNCEKETSFSLVRFYDLFLEKIYGLFKVLDSINNVELETSEEEAIYSVSGSSSGKLLLVIPVTVEITQKINAETGEIISTEKPWWTFLASGI